MANLSDINDECEVTPPAPTGTDNCSGVITGTGTPDVSFQLKRLVQQLLHGIMMMVMETYQLKHRK
ncbi:MAG: hypothetical protein MK105_02625 [Crocinitomicaceae bacterium]|nr:hypothetical protein [Crocinitomicaceae bacterium]